MNRIFAVVLTLVMTLSLLSGSFYMQFDRSTPGVIYSDDDTEIVVSDDDSNDEEIPAPEDDSLPSDDEVPADDETLHDDDEILPPDEVPDTDAGTDDEEPTENDVTAPSDDNTDNGDSNAPTEDENPSDGGALDPAYGDVPSEDGDTFYPSDDYYPAFGAQSDDIYGTLDDGDDTYVGPKANGVQPTVSYKVKNSEGIYEDFKPGDDYLADSDFQVSLKWDWSGMDYYEIKDMVIDLGALSADMSKYTNPQDVYFNGVKCGQYYVKDGNLYIEFEEFFKNCTDITNRYASVDISGTLNVSEEEDVGKDSKDVTIAEENVTINPEFKDSKLDARKEMSTIQVDADGNFYSHVKLTFKAEEGLIKDFYFSDIFSDPTAMYLKNGIDGISYKVFDASGNDITDTSECKLKPPIQEMPNGFYAEFEGHLHKGEMVIVEYDVILPAEKVKTTHKNDNKITNEVDVEWQNNNDTPGHDKPGAGAGVGWTGQLEKSGEWHDDESGITYIDWAIKYNFNIDLSEFIAAHVNDTDTNWADELKKAGINPYVCDTIPEGLDYDLSSIEPASLRDQFKWNEEDRVLCIPLIAFVVNEHYRQESTFHLKTIVTDKDAKSFTNNVDTDIFDEPKHGGDTVKPGGSVGDHSVSKKAADSGLVRNDDGSYTLVWEVTVNLPDGDFSEYELKDWTDQYRRDGGFWVDLKIPYDGIKLIWASCGIDNIPQNAIDYSGVNGNNNASIKIYGPGHGGEFVPAGTTLKFAITTNIEKLTDDGTPYDGDVSFTNHVQGTVNGDTKQADADYSTTLEYKSSFDKFIVDQNGIDIKWEIKLKEDIIYFPQGSEPATGLIFDKNGLRINITDYIPDGMEYLDGSFELYFYYNYPTYNDVVDESTFFDDLFDIIRPYITVEKLDDGNIRFKADKGVELKNQVLQYLDGCKFEYGGEGWSRVDTVYDTFNNYGIKLGIRYVTRVTDIDSVLGGDPNSGTNYKNTADGTVNNDKGHGEITGTITVGWNSGLDGVLKKQAYYDTDPGKYPDDSEFGQYHTTDDDGKWPNVYYTIEINEGKFTLNNGNPLTVVDVMGKSLDVILKSIRVLKYDDALGKFVELSEDDDYSYVINDVDGGDTTITFTVPDNEHILITYWAAIKYTNDDGYVEWDTAGNTVTLKGQSSDLVSDKTDSINKQVSIDANMGYDTKYLDIFKYTIVNGAKKGLKGATFELIPGVFADWQTNDDPNAKFIYGKFEKDEQGNKTDNFIPANNKDEVHVVQEADGFTTTFIVSKDEDTIDPDTLYELRELYAPVGYKRSDEVRYIYFTKYNKDDERHQELLKRGVIFVGSYKELEYNNDPVVAEAIPEVTKTLIGAELTDYIFTFKVDVEAVDKNGDTLVDSWQLRKTTATTDDSGHVHFENITFYNEGTYTVTITEIDDGKDGIEYDTHKFVITYVVEYVYDANGQNPKLTVTSIKYDADDAEFVNEYVDDDNGSLSVKKVVEGVVISPDKKFEITVTLCDSENQPLEGPFKVITITEDENSNTTESEPSEVKFENGKYTFKLGHNKTVKIVGLPVGTKYTVVEATGENFPYIVSYEPNNEGIISVEENSEAFVKVKNTMQYDLPATGASGTERYLYFGIALLITGFLLLFLDRRFRGKPVARGVGSRVQ